MLVFKIVRPEIKVVDAAGGRIEAVASTEAEDRDGDIIRASGWVLDSFLKHPVMLSSHNYMDLRAVIGEWESLEVVGKKLKGTTRYYIGEGNEQADWAFRLAAKGRAAYSVGFMPLEEPKERTSSRGGSGWEFTKQELLEVSHVSVPANPQALQLMVKSGTLHPEIDAMVKEMLEEDRQVDLSEFFKGAIPPHTSPKADEDAPWDAGAEVRQAEGAIQLRRMHAWVDPEGDPENKGSYKLPHHQASGEVVWRGVAAAGAAIMGARGGVTIPQGDVAGVKRHLARHYEQFDKTPPWESEGRVFNVNEALIEATRMALIEEVKR